MPILELKRKGLGEQELKRGRGGIRDIEFAVQLLQLTREALSNVARHAEAHAVSVELAVHDGMLRLTITDDGRGFDPTASRGPAHHGLNNMRARAESLGGTLTMDSRPAAGTRVIFQVPLEASAAGEDFDR